MTDDDLGTAISPESLYRRLARGDRLTILDTRDRDEFDAWHVDGPGVRAVQVPHLAFLQAEATGGADDVVDEYNLESPVVAVCARGEASDHAAGLLRDAGLDAANLAGGMEAWARAYVGTDLAVAGPAVRQYVRPSSGCLAYLVHDGDEAVVVDPLAAFAERYVDDAAELGVEIVAVVDTHVHADHVSGLRDVAETAATTAYLPEGAVDRGLDFDVELLDDGDAIAVGAETVEAMHVPGHTSEMTAFRAGDVVFTGDSLFVESVARPDLEAGDEGASDLAAQLHASLHDRIFALPDDTLVAPGHVGQRTAPDAQGAYVATIAELREDLALLGLDRDAFVDRILDDMPPRPANYERLIRTNLGLETLDAEEGFELELGPNNCAVSA